MMTLQFRPRCALVGALGCLWLCCGDLVGQEASTTNANTTSYTCKISKGFVPTTPIIELPDIAQFTVAATKSKLPAHFAGQAAIGLTAGEACISESFQGKRSGAFQKMQGTADTRVIKVTDGALTLKQVVEQVDDPSVIEIVGNETIVRLPLLVMSDATLVIQGDQTPIVRLVTRTGTILANTGTLFVVDATVSSWDERTGTTTAFADAKQFRPFLASFSSSKTYLAGSTFHDLGYSSPSAYGLTLTSHPNRHMAEDSGHWPTGILVDNTFRGLYYGFYSFEARDVAIVNNRYVDSIRYGIDPHDRSTRLIIAGNLAEGTVERHGIIGSRGISHSFIFDNVSRKNTQSGIMLDRQCTENVITNNRVYDNGNGIAIYESPANRIVDNVIAFNGGNGVRVRNSVDVLVQGNTIVGNDSFAVTCEGRQLDDHEKRVQRGDTYQTQAGVAVYANTISHNGDGMFKGRNLTYLRVGDLQQQFEMEALTAATGGAKRDLPAVDNDLWGGDLEAYESEFRALLESPDTLLEMRANGT